VHLQLTNIPSQQTVDHITVWPYGAGEYLYNQNPAVAQSAAFFRSSGSTSGDLYVQPMANYTNNSFAVDIYYTGAANPVVVFAQVNANAQLPIVSARSLGQDGHDYASRANPTAPDGHQDLHIALSGIPSYTSVSFIDVLVVGGTSEWQYGGQNSAIWGAVYVPNESGPNTGGLYIQPDSSFLNTNGTQKPQNLLITIKYANGTTVQTYLNNVTANPNI
jgi:hypothetical protein